jgi:endo-1,4-beta-mannosidase
MFSEQILYTIYKEGFMKTKLCPKCNKTHSVEDFPRTGTRRRSWCKTCWKQKDIEYHAEWYKKNKEKHCARVELRRKKHSAELRKYISTIKKKCSVCGYDKYDKALEYHHINNDNKDCAIAVMVSNGYSKERINKEIAKCIVLCANCHREVHGGITCLKTT